MSNPYAQHNEVRKANFDGVYDLPDPRGYFQALGALDYRAPEHGRRVFSALLALIGEDESRSKVLDLCCSYGVNAALLKHDLTLDDLYARYASAEIADLSAGELATADARFYAGPKVHASPQVVGTDLAANAVSYALRAGLLDDGTSENLEEGEPSEALRRAARGARLVTVTGGVGYVWERTFERALSCVIDGPAGGVRTRRGSRLSRCVSWIMRPSPPCSSVTGSSRRSCPYAPSRSGASRTTASGITSSASSPRRA